ncbi:hypothetical protein Ari01nite_75460 [Paractinoplanes rishiriensis]|uniref:Uncharacterized protein n=1 Tax=Paractinoplanes rishiriensis TaxID=1050105 RepID=A0A919K391_9ACTN|nr:hypothetical protein Ari01nite_75460 [Actinoplanes rishiriensis]
MRHPLKAPAGLRVAGRHAPAEQNEFVRPAHRRHRVDLDAAEPREDGRGGLAGEVQALGGDGDPAYLCMIEGF